ncbi:hypothetical protein BCR42DRAFT_397853 [Absidia repens]|uniref:CCHC-type domain-containing protein n=1 Tax=Absidia repens TaxID=90262 RepID=A0A1X2I155_9FUNG|nr:hypothetical protein BCR42DRAFT_397853 [Absidia repens]
MWSSHGSFRQNQNTRLTPNSGQTWAQIAQATPQHQRSARVSLLANTTSTPTTATSTNTSNIIRTRLFRTGRNDGSFFVDVSSRPESESALFQLILKQFPSCRGAAPFREGRRRFIEVNLDPLQPIDISTFKTTGLKFADGKQILPSVALPDRANPKRVTLSRMPFLSKDEIHQGLTTTLKLYGKVIDVGVLTDPISGMYLGSGYAIIDTTTPQTGSPYPPLVHNLPWPGLQNGFLATCESMTNFCKYCHKDGHVRDNCPTAPPIRLCYNCKRPGHIAAYCPDTSSHLEAPPTSVPSPMLTHQHSAAATRLSPSALANQQPTPTSASNSPARSDASTSDDTPEDQLQEGSSSPSSDSDDFSEINQAIRDTGSPAGNSNMEVSSIISNHGPSTSDDPSTTDAADFTLFPDTQHQPSSLTPPPTTQKQSSTNLQEDRSFLQDHNTSSSSKKAHTKPINFKMGSLNCRSLIKINSPKTRTDMIRYLYSQSLSILAVQESHATETHQPTLNRHFPHHNQTLWTSNCGLISFSPDYQLNSIPFTTNSRCLAARITNPANRFPPFFVLVIYAPSTSPSDRQHFYAQLTSLLHAPTSPLPLDQLIILGDFNYSLISPNRTLHRVGEWSRLLSTHFTNCLSIHSDNHLLPTFHHTVAPHPPTIDHIFASHTMAQSVCSSSVEFMSPVWTDHCLITATFQLHSNTPIGKGVWRANPIFTSHKAFQHALHTHLNKIIPALDSYTPQAQWEKIKTSVRQFTKRYGRTHTSWRIKTLKSLQSGRNALLRTKSNTPSIKRQLYWHNQLIAHLQQEQTSILQLRSHTQWVEKSEKSPKYLARKIRTRQIQQTMPALHNPHSTSESERTDDPEIMKRYASTFYNNLFAKEPSPLVTPSFPPSYGTSCDLSPFPHGFFEPLAPLWLVSSMAPKYSHASQWNSYAALSVTVVWAS